MELAWIFLIHYRETNWTNGEVNYSKQRVVPYVMFN